jgi:hypothetical protein
VNITIKPSVVIATPPQEDFDALAPPPALLPGESLERYQFMRQAILADIAPQSAIEWLLVIDVIELSWEIERYRLLRQKVVDLSRQRAIEQGLRRIDLIDPCAECNQAANRHIRRNAVEWPTNPDTASEIEARLAAYGIDQQTINAGNLMQAREFFVLFQALLDAAQSRRISLLREIKLLRPTGSVAFGGNAQANSKRGCFGC